MIRLHALGTQITIPPLTLIVPLLAARLGLRGAAASLMPALCLHEAAHIGMAWLTGVKIEEIRLLPFGGSARMENPYCLPPKQIVLTAAAGPAANLLLAFLWAFLAQIGWIRPTLAWEGMQPNWILSIFNLLPALPLDGGRILFALTQGALGEKRALKICIWNSRVLAAALLGAAMVGGVRSGSWNLTLILAGIFIITSIRDERRALCRAQADMLEEQLHSPATPQRTRIYQLDAATPLHEAISLLRPRERTWFVLLKDGVPSGLADGRSIVAQILAGAPPETALNDLAEKFRLCAGEKMPFRTGNGTI